MTVTGSDRPLSLLPGLIRAGRIATVLRFPWANRSTFLTAARMTPSLKDVAQTSSLAGDGSQCFRAACEDIVLLNISFVSKPLRCCFLGSRCQYKARKEVSSQ